MKWLTLYLRCRLAEQSRYIFFGFEAQTMFSDRRFRLAAVDIVRWTESRGNKTVERIENEVHWSKSQSVIALIFIRLEEYDKWMHIAYAGNQLAEMARIKYSVLAMQCHAHQMDCGYESRLGSTRKWNKINEWIIRSEGKHTLCGVGHFARNMYVLLWDIWCILHKLLQTYLAPLLS